MREVALFLYAFGTLGCVRSPEMRAEGWWSARTAHIALETDGGGERATEAATSLETLHHALTLAFYRCAYGAEDDVVEVTVLSHDDEYQALFPDTAGVSLPGDDGLVVTPPRIVLRGNAVARTDLVFAHELTHAFVRACFPDAPSWLHEGLASVFETIRRQDASVIVGEPAYAFTTEAYAGVGWDGRHYLRVVPTRHLILPSALMSLSAVELYSPRGDERRSGEQARVGRYASAWALVHMLALGPDSDLRERFLRYLAALSAGAQTRQQAFEAAFGGVDLDAAFEQYVRTTRFTGLEHAWTPIDDPPTSQALSTEQGHLALASLMMASGQAQAARTHLDAARAVPSTRARALLLDAVLAPVSAPRLVGEAERIAPESLDVQRAAILIARGIDDRQALDLAEQMARRDDLRSADLAVIASVEDHAGLHDEAFAHARAAVEGAPRAWWARYELGRVAFHAHDCLVARAAMQWVSSAGAHGPPAILQSAAHWLARIASACPPL